MLIDNKNYVFTHRPFASIFRESYTFATWQVYVWREPKIYSMLVY